MGGEELRARPSKRNLPSLLRYLATVAVQDSLALVDICPGHPVVNLLLNNETFRCYTFTNAFHAFMSSGTFRLNLLTQVCANAHLATEADSGVSIPCHLLATEELIVTMLA